MKAALQQRKTATRAMESHPQAAKQAPTSVILQRYLNKTVQKEAVPDEDELVQGKFSGTAQMASLDEDGLPLQAKSGNRTGLPDNLKSGIENLSGLSMDDVRVHYNSPKPAQLRTLAYTQGTDIHVAPGQEKHLGHEAWHVVQQKQGRVQPTMQLQGVSVNDDEGLEREADRMGEKAVQFIYPQTRINDKSSSKNRCIVTQRLNPGDLPVNARAAYATTNPLLHPETIDFLSMMNAIGVPVNVAYEIWQYLLLALEDQDFYNTAALIAHYPNLNLIQSNDEIRQGNALYHLVARMIRPYLNAGDLIGLWSGGFDLSQYAASIGCTTLEETPFGFILDSLYLTNSWARLGPLWNVISREFVNVAIMNSAEFHVFIRVYDVNSVLIRQEVNQIRRVAPQLAIFWHPIVSEGPDYLEIDENCNLSENHQACSESECLSRLIYYHHNLYTLGRENATMSANLINEYDLSSMDDALVHLAMV